MNVKANIPVYATNAVFAENIGRVGRTIGLSHEDGVEGPEWLVEWCEPVTTLERKTCKVMLSAWSHHPDAWLRLIDAAPTTQDVREEIEA
ncbi:TPA: hypothetical protein VDB83_001187 [Burkholderia cenocepacia]|uniref:hypothetical protein n=1 Tax=Burkholderia cenocepacia TaxID=95486 RepID=UPI001B9DD51A|nr:hypothetical protein [Burkholderia cenocepacia]MBR8096347.1 hypothetical protein [Burkholderia cenocepacia]HEP6426916.1 hypothetical protein [Burkholderia cenocepacia]